MNEHDSERLAGIMVADGLERAENDADADVIIFNTCTIRENADLKLYSALGQLKALKEQRPAMQIAVGGCMAQKDRGEILERAGSTWSLGRTTSPRPRDCCAARPSRDR